MPLPPCLPRLGGCHRQGSAPCRLPTLAAGSAAIGSSGIIDLGKQQSTSSGTIAAGQDGNVKVGERWGAGALFRRPCCAYEGKLLLPRMAVPA